MTSAERCTVLHLARFDALKIAFCCTVNCKVNHAWLSHSDTHTFTRIHTHTHTHTCRQIRHAQGFVHLHLTLHFSCTQSPVHSRHKHTHKYILSFSPHHHINAYIYIIHIYTPAHSAHIHCPLAK